MQNYETSEKTIFDLQDTIQVSEEAKQFALAYDQAPEELKDAIRTLLECSKPGL